MIFIYLLFILLHLIINLTIIIIIIVNFILNFNKHHLLFFQAPNLLLLFLNLLALNLYSPFKLGLFLNFFFKAFLLRTFLSYLVKQSSLFIKLLTAIIIFASVIVIFRYCFHNTCLFFIKVFCFRLIVIINQVYYYCFLIKNLFLKNFMRQFYYYYYYYFLRYFLYLVLIPYEYLQKKLMTFSLFPFVLLYI